MPTYEYRCENDHLFEVIQRMADDTLESCTICGAPVQRVFHPVAVHFKGSGFYSTDYGKRKGGSDSKSDSANSDSSSSKDSSKGSDSKGSDSKGSDSKSSDSKSSDSKTKASSGD